MLVYLDQEWTARVASGTPTRQDLFDSVMRGAVERVRPMMTTVAYTIIGLLPILWGGRTGASVMKRKRVGPVKPGGQVSPWRRWAWVRLFPLNRSARSLHSGTHIGAARRHETVPTSRQESPMRRSFALLALVLFTGCRTTTRLTPRAEAVRLTLNRDEVKGCRLVGNVEESTTRYLVYPGKGAAAENVQRQLRNDAAKMGANVIVVSSSTTGSTSVRTRGEAYACA